MKIAIFASLVAAASAFAPASQCPAVTTSLEAAPFANELGSQAPLGYFDPLELVVDGDQEKFDRLRYVELKHGRIAQLAFLGYLTTYLGKRLPGNLELGGKPFAEIPSGFAALKEISAVGWVQIIGFCGYLELEFWQQKEGSFPGDFTATTRAPVGYLNPKITEEEKYILRAKELNQGRAAMMGILGVMVHDKLDGTGFIFF